MKSGYLHIAVVMFLSQVALAQQPTIKIWAAPATDFDALPGHMFDSGELNFMSYFVGCPSLIPPFPLSNDCGTTTVYYVWGQFINVPNNARITGLHILASPLGGATILNSVIYRHHYDSGGIVWDRWDSANPIIMYGDPYSVGYAYGGTGNGIRNSSAENLYDLYCYGTRMFLIGAVEMLCPQPCGDSWLQLGLGPYGFQVLSAGGSDISSQVLLQLGDQPAISNPPPSGDAYWYQIGRCGGFFFDCNGNDIPDQCDISCSAAGCEGYTGCGQSVDCDGNAQPDECQSGLVPPSILEQPTSQTRCIGQAATFTVVAEGNPAPTYRWFKNAHVIPGATEAAYTIPWVDPLDAGDYAVWAVTTCEVVISETVTLTVLETPTIAVPPAEQTITAGDTATFSVSASGGGTYAYQWRRAALPLSDGPFVTGATTDTLTIQRADTTDAGWYDVVVTNECGYVVSPHALLTVNAGPCPPRGAPYVTKTYVLTGDANNTPWSWRIESTDGKFTDAVELHVNGVPEGGALAVAQQFADSVNAYAAAHGRGADELYAVAKEAVGQTLLAIRTGGNAGFRLWVGPANEQPSCLVVPEQLPACGFNPTITAVPDEPAVNAAQPAPSPAPGCPYADSDEPVGRLVGYDPRTGQVTHFVVPRTHAGERRADRPRSQPVRVLDHPAEPARGDRDLMYPISDPNWPFSAVCKIFYRQMGEDREATGFFFDAKHVLTSGMVVNTGGDWDSGWVAGRYSSFIEVVPFYWDGGDSQKRYRAVSFWSWDDFVTRGDTQDMLGVIELECPIGVVTRYIDPWPLDRSECFGYWNWYNDDNWHYPRVVGFPNETPYTDGGLYRTWSNTVQTCGWDRFDERSFYGMRGAPAYDSYYHDYYTTYAFRWVQAWDDSAAPTRLVPIRDYHMDDLWGHILHERPDTPDLVPYRFSLNSQVFEAGDTISANLGLVNYSDADANRDTFNAHLYLSYDNTIEDHDQLLDTAGAYSCGALDTTSAYFQTQIPATTPAGTCWIGARYDYADAHPDNNVTGYDLVTQIEVTCGAITTPTNLRASDGTSNSRIEVRWDAVPGDNVLYDLYRDDDSEPHTAPYRTGLTTTYFYDDDPNNLIPGQTYYYWLRAYNLCGHEAPLTEHNTGWVAFASAPHIEASDGTDPTHVVITWEPVEGATSYYVWRADVCEPNVLNLQVYSGGETTCEDPWGPTTGRRYYYFAQAVAGENESGITECEVGWKGVPEPNQPRASDGDVEYFSDRVHIDWDLLPGITHYQVWRAELLDPNTLKPLDPNWVHAGTWYDADFDDLDAVPGVDYKYYVRGSYYADGSCPGPLSPPDRGWRLLNPPTNVVASDGEYAEEVILSWNAQPGGVRFTILRGTTPDPDLAQTLENLPRPSPWIVETGWADTTAVPGVQYYYWVRGCGGHWCAHMTGVGTPDTGWRAVDCNGNHIPDQLDPNAIAPTVDQPPLDQDACLGVPTTFTVSATSSGNPSYQWRRNGSPIPDANTPTFTIPWTDPGDADTYDVVVTDGCGTTTSVPATLSVLMPVSIVDQPDDVMDIIHIGDTVTFSVTATGEPPLTYQWRHGTVPVSNGGNIAGATSDTLTLSNVQPEDAGAYDVVVTNGCGSVTSLPGSFVVMQPPCPPMGSAALVHTYAITGDGLGGDWSWKIESADGKFESLSRLAVPGVTGTALEVAQALAASINDCNCPHARLSADAAEVAGTVMLAIRTSVESPVTLYVGPAEAADCRVELPAAACQFNPLIEQLPLPGRDCNRNGQDDLVDLIAGTSADADHNGIPDECAVGDMNCDGVATYADINPFVLALGGQAHYEARYPDCRWMNADINGDGVVSYADINPFVALLAGR